MSRVGQVTSPLRKSRAARSVSVDDILDYLASPQGRPTVLAIKGRLEKAGANFKEFMGPGFGPQSYPDGFDGVVLDTLYRSFLLPSSTAANIPNAVAYALAHARNQQGQVTSEAARQVLGPRGQEVVDEIIAATGGAPVPTSRPALKYANFPNEVCELIAGTAVRPDLRARMPALAAISKRFGGPQALAHARMIGVQHLFPTTRALFDELKDNGLAPEKVALNGKPYSANGDVLYGMRADGWSVSTLGYRQLLTNRPDGSTRAHNAAVDYLAGLFKDVDLAHPPQDKFMLLDEGGALIEALHLHYPEYAHLCVAVEQTEHGIQVIERMQAEGIELKCAVVNVAQSRIKKKLESPMIGESIAQATLAAIDSAGVDRRDAPKEVCIIGYGAVGTATADALRRRGYTVYVHDIKPEALDRAAADGCIPLPREQALAHGHLTISCTGNTTITPDEFDQLLPDQAVLVNAASGNHELGMDQIAVAGGKLTDDPHERIDDFGFRLSQFGGTEVMLGDIAGQEDDFARVIRAKSGRERLVIKAGYVVNMRADIPPEYIQLTRAALLAACLQAMGETRVGLVELRQDMQELIIDETRRCLAASGKTLEAPDFDELAPAEG